MGVGNMKKEEKITLVINPDKTKEEIIYENVVSNLHLTMDEQVKFLRNKTFSLEKELKERTNNILLFLFSFLVLCFGILLLCFDLYILGIVLILATFLFIVLKLLLNFRIKEKALKNNEFDKVEELIQLFSKKLK